ncbi:MAG: tetratricopeptide repeat protein [Hyphomonadaceae bacterium]
MRTILITLALCAAPCAFAQTSLFPSTPLQDRYGYGGSFGAGSSECTSSRRAASAERAIEVCTQLIGMNLERSDIALAHYVLGDRYEDLGRQDEANAEFEQGVAIFQALIDEAPLGADQYVGRSLGYLRLNRFDDAIADATRAINYDDSHVQAHSTRAFLYFRTGNYQGAMADYDRAARLGQRRAARGSMRAIGPREALINPRVYGVRCETRAAAGIELDVAEEACRIAVRNSAASTFSRGFLRFKQGRFEEAWADFNTAYEENDTSGFSLYGRGVAAVRLGRQEEGEADIARAREIEGDDLDGYVNAGLVP